MKRFTYEFKRMVWLLLMLVCAHGTTVAQKVGDTFTVGNLYYRVLNEQEVEVAGHVDRSDATGEVIIPETVEAAEWNRYYIVTTIGYAAFLDCDGLTSINIPESVTTIADEAFLGCNRLTAIMVNADNAKFSSFEGVLFDKSLQKLIQYPAGKQGEYDIPNSVITIGSRAFYDCDRLTAINIPNSVTTIGEYAFQYCRGLTTINIPNSVTAITNGAFNECSGLTAINIPNSVTSIGNGAFEDCDELTTINIPNSVTLIGNGAFNSCSGLTAINIPNSVTSIGNGAFSNCIGVTSINIPNSVTIIGERAFSYCHGLTNINISNSVTTIGENTFEGCSGLTTINIPNSVTSIRNGAFFYCSELATLYFQSIIPPTASEGCFLGCYNLQTIYVPQEAVSTYQATAPYNEHNIQGIAPIRSELGDEVRTWNTLYCQKMPATEWINHGVLKSAAQLKTNKQETSEGAIANLLDGDTQTFFHSTYNVPNTNMEAHYLQVDLGGELQHLLVKYAERNNPNNSEPRKVKVYATKDTLNGWTDLGTARFLNRTGTLRMDLGAPYRYLKLEIVETFSNMENNGNRFFTWSELGIWNGAALHPETCQQVPALLAQIEEAEALGQEPSDELTAQATALKAQLIKGDTCRFYDKAFHAVRTQAEANIARAEYVRNYEHTNWQALYLPFDIAFDDISDRFDVASLNDIHQYNDNENGQLDRTELKVQHLKAGSTLKANIPYMVRAKQTGEQTMAATNVTVQPMTSKQLDCSTIHYRYLFTGNYQEISGQDMFTKKYYAMSQGNLSLAANNTVYLSPFRWYMAAEDRTGNSAAYTPKMIRVVDIETGETTGIGEVETTEVPQSGNIYDLNGRLVRTDGNLQALPKGIYILNGKKVVR